MKLEVDIVNISFFAPDLIKTIKDPQSRSQISRDPVHFLTYRLCVYGENGDGNEEILSDANTNVT